MQSKIDQYTSEINAFSPANTDELETFRIKYLGTKGLIKDLFEQFKTVGPEEKRTFGKVLNQFKQLAEARYAEMKETLGSTAAIQNKQIDLTLPGDGFVTGSRHPLSLVRNEIIDIFKRLGFIVAEGPEIEDDWHNFSALNFPEEHPARDMQDTFFIRKGSGQDDIALRTHTSSVQVRMMENGKPPFRAIMPGRVYRNEAISARAHCFFHQIEGLYVDENVSFADLKQTLYYFVQELYGEGTLVRFRPSYFPFTEPSAEMDISCTICKGDGCNMCKYSGWVEILGCGMVDPNVLENCGIDSEKYTGFAFGMGMERIANLKYVIRDLRLFSENDVRFFNTVPAGDHMKYSWLPALAAILFFACGKAGNIVPNVAVNLRIAKTDPRLAALNSSGGAVLIAGYGVAGLIIYREPDGSYAAYDRCSSYQPEKKCAVTLDSSGFTATDPCSGSKFSLTDGGPVKAPATRSLKAYTVNVSNFEIFVSN